MSRKLFVANFPFTTTVEELQSLFGSHGSVVYANIAARQWLAGGRSLVGSGLAAVLAQAPAGLAAALQQPRDQLFSVAAPDGLAGHEEQYHLSQRELRLQGASYEEIAKAGGGILSSVRRTREQSPEALFDEGRARLHPQIVRWASGVRIDVPSLAERIEDLDVIAMDVLRRLPTRRPIGGIADNALDCMRTYAWPSNIDEVAEVLTEAIEAGSSEQVELRDLPAKLRVRDLHQGSRSESPERQLCLEEAEKQAIRRALNYARGNKRKAARLLHIGKTTLYRKLKQYDLE